MDHRGRLRLPPDDSGGRYYYHKGDEAISSPRNCEKPSRHCEQREAIHKFLDHHSLLRLHQHDGEVGYPLFRDDWWKGNGCSFVEADIYLKITDAKSRGKNNYFTPFRRKGYNKQLV